MEELRNMRTGALSKEDAYVTILLISNISPTGYCGKANHCISCIT